MDRVYPSFVSPGIYDRFFESYENLSPTERNDELLRLFQQLPYSIVHEDPFAEISLESADLHGQEYARRRASESRNILSQRVAALLAYTNTTLQFQFAIYNQFCSWYDRGVIQEEMIFSKLPRMIFAEFRDNEGLFNNSNAKNIERTIYLSQVKDRLSILTMLQEEIGTDYDIEARKEFRYRIRAFRSINPSLEQSNPELFEQELQRKIREARDEEAFMNHWPQAFLELHGEDI